MLSPNSLGLLLLFMVGLLVPVGVILPSDDPPPEKVPAPAALPDPLLGLDGTKVTTVAQWEKQRRPELKTLFQNYIYGQLPPAVKVSAKVERTDPQALGGKATLKEITLTLGDGKAPKIHLLLVVPNKRTGPAPVFVGLNFTGNHTLLNDPKIRLPESWMRGTKSGKASDAERGKETATWSIEQTIDKGFAVATCYYGDLVPDDPARRDDGVQPAVAPQSDWGAVAAWAWGLSRIADYLVTLDEIDATKMIVIGHSRLGKATLLAGAFDDRFAIVMPHQSGQGGAAPNRGTVGESVERINTSFPHWFNAEFKKFNKTPERLPIDANCLVALCAPRPVLFSNAVKDTWANPAGQLDVLRAAESVYRLYDVPGVAVKEMPMPGMLIDSPLGYYYREGAHSMTPEDWRNFVAYAEVQFARRAKASK